MGVADPHSLAAFVSERLMDLVVVGSLASLALGLFSEHGRWLGGALIVLVLAVVVLRSQRLSTLVKRLFTGAASLYATAGTQALRTLFRIRSLGVALPMSALAWTSQGVALHVVLGVVGHELALPVSLAVYALGILAGAASFVPGACWSPRGPWCCCWSLWVWMGHWPRW